MPIFQELQTANTQQVIHSTATLNNSRRLTVLGIILYVLFSSAVYFFVRPGALQIGDSADYFSAAQSMSEGRALLSADGRPFVLWTPLYPALLTPIYLFNLNPQVWAGLLNVLAIFGTARFSFLFFRKITKAPILSLAGSLLFFTHSTVLVLSSRAISEHVFIFIISLLIYLVEHALRQKKAVHWIAFTATALVMTRNIGIVFVGWAAILLWRNGLRKQALWASLPATLAACFWYLRSVVLVDGVQREFGFKGILEPILQELLNALSSMSPVSAVDNNFIAVFSVALIVIFTISFQGVVWRTEIGSWSRRLGWAMIAYFFSITGAQLFLDASLRYDARLFYPLTIIGLYVLAINLIRIFSIPRFYFFKFLAYVVLVLFLSATVVWPIGIQRYHTRAIIRQAEQKEVQELLVGALPLTGFSNDSGLVYLSTGLRFARIGDPREQPNFGLGPAYSSSIIAYSRLLRDHSGYVVLRRDKNEQQIIADLTKNTYLEKIRELKHFVLYLAP